jgi:hypothetical protein
MESGTLLIESGDVVVEYHEQYRLSLPHTSAPSKNTLCVLYQDVSSGVTTGAPFVLDDVNPQQSANNPI